MTSSGDARSDGTGYVDIYLLPVPAGNIDAYKNVAEQFGAVVRERGAVSYREFLLEDPGEGMAAAEGFVQTAAIAEFDSRRHRDEVMEAVMADERVTALLDGEQPAEMSQMRFGGFETFIAG